MLRHWRAATPRRSRRFEPIWHQPVPPPLLTRAGIANRTATRPRRGVILPVVATPSRPPVWIAPMTTGRRPLPYLARRARTLPFPLGSFGPHETLWRIGTPGNGWQFGTPVIS